MRRQQRIDGPDASSIRAHLQEILDSNEFAQSERMRRFLCFVVSETLAGRADQLKEYTIATHVFDRPASFDPTVDPVVRAEARRLREKLTSYYHRCGTVSGLMISLPKGRYVPEFSPVAGPVGSTAPAALAMSEFRPLSAGAERCCSALVFEIIDQLTRCHGITVAILDRSTPIWPRDDGTQVLTGCIRLHRDRVRVLAHLIDSRTGHCNWSIALEAEQCDAAEEALATDLARRLALHLREARATPAG